MRVERPGTSVTEARVRRRRAPAPTWRSRPPTDGHGFTVGDVQRAFDVARRLSGMRPELTLYSLRHSFASWLAIAGVPLRTIQEVLGHTDLRMTLKYAHLSPAHLTEKRSE